MGLTMRAENPHLSALKSSAGAVAQSGESGQVARRVALEMLVCVLMVAQ